MIRSAASAAPTAAGTPDAVNRNARLEIRRKSITSCGPAMKPPQDASDLLNVPIRRSTSASTPKSSEAPAPRAPSTPAAVRLVDHQARAVGLAQLDDLRQRGDVALHEKTPSTTTSTPPPSSSARWSIFSSRSSRLCLNGRSLAREIRQPSRIDGVVGGVDDHRVAGREDRARACRRWPGGRSRRRSPPRCPSTPRARLEVQVQVQRAVEQARAGQAGAVLVERVAGGFAGRAGRRSARGSCWSRA